MAAPQSEQYSGQVERISGLTPELFDLMVATVNLLTAFEVSPRSLLDKLILEDHNSQDVLSFIVGELEELEGMDIMNAPYAPLDM